MKRFNQYILVLLLLLPVMACNKFLEVEPRGVQLLSTVTDYDKWLNNVLLEGSLAREINLLADNVDNPVIPDPVVSVNDNIYTWADQFNPTTVNADPLIWKNHYQSINYFNTVLLGIDQATGGTEQQKATLKAEALLGRAFEYFYLVNLYGKPYDALTAASDIAVPFTLSNDVSDQVPDPSTVKVIYDHIFADLNAALPNLPADNPTNRYRGSVAAGYSVLARVYFYMRNYSEAAKYAQIALDRAGREMIDYNTITSSANFSYLVIRPDALYARIAVSFGTTEIPTVEFVKSFDKNDLRLKYFFSPSGNNNPTARNQVTFRPAGVPSATAYANWGTSVGEMRLIIAEAAARSGDLATALQQLDAIRKRRFPTAVYQAFQSGDQEEVLEKILTERKFELTFNGMRWFDMRRLDKEGRMPTVNRYDAANRVIATLPPKSVKYTLQIPEEVRYFNPGWQNTR